MTNTPKYARKYKSFVANRYVADQEKLINISEYADLENREIEEFAKKWDYSGNQLSSCNVSLFC